MESSTPKPKRASRNRSSRAPSTSTSTPESRGSQRRKQRRKEDATEREPYYKVKRIIQQRLKGGVIEYLLDWEDNPWTGEIYQPTWEPRRNCTAELIQSWQESQNHDQSQSQNDTLSLGSSQPSPLPPLENQPTHLKKRRRVATESPLGISQERTPSKKPRRVGTAQSARFQSVSQETIDSEILPSEIKDSYEEDDEESSEVRSGNPQVEIGVPEDFDRDAYARYLSSSQPSQQTHSASNSGYNTNTSSQYQASSARRPFLWFEDIPETPRLPGSSTYKPSTPPSSNTGLNTAEQTETSSSEAPRSTDSRSAQWTSSHIKSRTTEDLDSQLAEPEAHFADVTYVQDSNHPSTPESHSAEGSSLYKTNTHSIEDTLEIATVGNSSRIEDVSIISVRSQPEFAPAVDFLAVYGEETNSLIQQSARPRFLGADAEIALPSIEDSQGEDYYSSSPPFQTQLPPEFSGTQSTTPSRDLSPPERSYLSPDIPEPSQHAQIIEECTQTLQQESSPVPSFVPTEKTVSSFEATWDASKVISSTLRPVNSPSRIRAQSQPLTDTDKRNHSLRACTAPFSTQPPLLDLQSRQPDNQTSLPGSSTPPRQTTLSPPAAPLTPTHQVSCFNSTSNFNMEQSPSEQSTAGYDAKTKIAELIAEARAAAIAKQVARASSSSSPSPAPTPVVEQTVPSLEGNPTLPVFTPVKDLGVPVSTPRLSPEASPENDADSTSLKIATQVTDEFIIPLPMVSHTRDIYVNTIRRYKTQRSTFLTDEAFDESLVGEIDNMMTELNRLCDHQDLIAEDPSTQREAPDEYQAKWAETISTKCIFLAEFLPLLRAHEKHIVILVRPGRMLEILESLFRWHGFVYRRADQTTWFGDESAGPMKITLLPTGGDVYNVDSASVVIAFDTTSRSISYLNELRQNTSSPTGLAPMLSLVVTHSVEHLDRCFSTDVEPIERKIQMVSCVSQIADNVGKLDLEEYPDPPGAAKVAAEFLISGASDGSWPIMAMPEIEGLDSPTNSLHGYEREGRSLGDPDQPLIEVPHSGLKRQSEEMMGFGSPKRQKLTPAPVESAKITDGSYTSDIIPQSSTNSIVEVMETAIPNEQQGGEYASLLKRVADLEAQLSRMETTEIELHEINRDLESRCQDYESSIREIQPKYQEALNDRGQFENEINLSRESEAQMRRQRDAKDVEMRRLQDRQDFIDSELDAARAALSASAVPQAAELSAMRAEVEKVNAENESLKKRLTSMSKDMEYMRSEYQKASNAAASSAAEVREAQSLIADLREKADSNRVRVHEINHGNEIAAHRQRIKELEAEKEEVVRDNEKKDGELKALANGRRGTRGTSVPRSPRLGGTMSPGPARPIGRVIQGTGSRGNSPAPGEFAPNRLGFGEALFQGPPGPTARWGNHLQ